MDILGNYQKGKDFVERTRNSNFLFSLVISYTETCEIPGITVAGANPGSLKYTPPADAEFLHYGFCKCIDSIPMTPDGKPTPALLTKVALESASIPQIIINAGSKIKPSIPFFESGMNSGKNISLESSMTTDDVLHAIDSGRIIGRTLASCTDCLIIGESIPGGTTTALATLRGLGIEMMVSSSMESNPTTLKNEIVQNALKRCNSDNPIEIISQVSDPLIPFIAGMISTASEISNVLLAGGTQMAAVLAFAKNTGYDKNKLALGTTSYIINDNSSDMLKLIESIDDVPIISIDPMLNKSKFSGLQAYSNGFVKEGVGAGGSIIASLLKTGINSEILLQKIDSEYSRIFT